MHGCRQRGAREAVAPPWIFKHGTNIVNRGLIVLFSAFFAIFRCFFPLALPPGRGLIVLFSVFFAIFRSFSPLPPSSHGNFSADALAFMKSLQRNYTDRAKKFRFIKSNYTHRSKMIVSFTRLGTKV